MIGIALAMCDRFDAHADCSHAGPARTVPGAFLRRRASRPPAPRGVPRRAFRNLGRGVF
jgi:hypothetical protein